jgi:thiol-disulfide isomerase/thioredoxin
MIDVYMRRFTFSAKLLAGWFAVLLVAAVARAGVVEDVRISLAQNNFSSAEAELNSYRAQNGVTPEYVEAYSWMARGALNAGNLDQAAAYAKETRTLVAAQSKGRGLDSEPHLPIALGAAIEVEAQVLAARGQRARAVSVLQTALQTYGSTSIRARIQKNLHLLSFEGRPAPALRGEQFLGSKPPTLAQLKGSPVLLFFWAHWCGDCKAEAPIITQLRGEFAPKGLQVLGPTRYYGYTAQEEHASPGTELAFIDAVRHRFYSGLLDMPVPISTYNFDVYGASTTPTLVLLDKSGKVAMYHPGAMPYAELRAEIEKVVGR